MTATTAGVIGTYVSWAVCVLTAGSVLLRPKSDFQNIGRHKWRWFWLNLLGVALFFAGIIIPIIYFWAVWLKLPRIEREPGPRPANRLGQQGVAPQPCHLCRGDGQVMADHNPVARGQIRAGRWTDCPNLNDPRYLHNVRR